ncbi:MAG: YdcH family protein, partial [Sphingomicrobium sp.]
NGRKGSRRASDGVESAGMNDLNPVGMLESLRAEHRQLDERIKLLSSEPTGDQLELARLKRRKLMLKDQIQLIVDSNVPDIIA